MVCCRSQACKYLKEVNRGLQQCVCNTAVFTLVIDWHWELDDISAILHKIYAKIKIIKTHFSPWESVAICILIILGHKYSPSFLFIYDIIALQTSIDLYQSIYHHLTHHYLQFLCLIQWQWNSVPLVVQYTYGISIYWSLFIWHL